MERTTLDLWVGIFVLAGLLALIVLAVKVGNLSSQTGHSDTYTVNAQFSNIGGLKIRAPVKSAGVVVGRVSDIKFDNGAFEALVSIKIGQEFKFPRDTAAVILTSGLLGEQYIGMEPGAETVYLKNGDKIALTQSAVVLEQLIGQFIFSKAKGE